MSDIETLCNVSNAFRLLGSGERHQIRQQRRDQLRVSNAFRLLGSGEQSGSSVASSTAKPCLKCLSAFGFWGTESVEAAAMMWLGESQMPFGFWVLGNRGGCQPGGHFFPRVSNAFRLLGSGEHIPVEVDTIITKLGLKCLSAFGFWGT